MRAKFFLQALTSLALVVAPAFADSLVFTLDHCTNGCGTAPFGAIELTQNGTNTVNVAVSLTNGDSFISSGFPGSLAFDLIGNPTISVTNLTTGWSLLSTAAGNLQFDGFGNLDYALLCNACQNGGSNPFSQPISFDVTAAGLTPASFLELSRIPPGSESAYFVADIIGTTGNTGPVGATIAAAPEPSSLLLFGAGSSLVALASIRRRKKTNQ